MPTEHRRPLVAFVLVALLSGIVIINGLRTQAVAHLVAQGGSHGLVAALAPEMVLGHVLREAGVPTGSVPSALLVNPGAARAAADERAVQARRAASTTTQASGPMSTSTTKAAGDREIPARKPSRVVTGKSPAKSSVASERRAARAQERAQQKAQKQARKAQKQAQKAQKKPQQAAPQIQTQNFAAATQQQSQDQRRARAEQRLRALLAQAQERAHKQAQKRAEQRHRGNAHSRPWHQHGKSWAAQREERRQRAEQYRKEMAKRWSNRPRHTPKQRHRFEFKQHHQQYRDRD